MPPLNTPRRGEIYWTEPEPTRGAEMRKALPCLVVTSTSVNRRRRSVVVIPLSTTSPKQFPLYIPMLSAGEDSQAVIDQIRVVDKGRLGDYVAMASQSEMDDVAEALKSVFAIA